MIVVGCRRLSDANLASSLLPSNAQKSLLEPTLPAAIDLRTSTRAIQGTSIAFQRRFPPKRRQASRQVEAEKPSHLAARELRPFSRSGEDGVGELQPPDLLLDLKSIAQQCTRD